MIKNKTYEEVIFLFHSTLVWCLHNFYKKNTTNMSWYLIVQMFKRSNYKDLPVLFSFALFLHVIKFEWKMKEKKGGVTLNHIVINNGLLWFLKPLILKSKCCSSLKTNLLILSLYIWSKLKKQSSSKAIVNNWVMCNCLLGEPLLKFFWRWSEKGY